MRGNKAAAILAASAVFYATQSNSDEGGISFWLPGLYGSLAATPTEPGWKTMSRRKGEIIRHFEAERPSVVRRRSRRVLTPTGAQVVAMSPMTSYLQVIDPSIRAVPTDRAAQPSNPWLDTAAPNFSKATQDFCASAGTMLHRAFNFSADDASKSKQVFIAISLIGPSA